MFGENSPEFAEAMKKISPGLLALIRDQFKCDPDALVRGAFQDDAPAAQAAQKQDAGAILEDDQTMQELEEGDD